MSAPTTASSSPPTATSSPPADGAHGWNEPSSEATEHYGNPTEISSSPIGSEIEPTADYTMNTVGSEDTDNSRIVIESSPESGGYESAGDGRDESEVAARHGFYGAESRRQISLLQQDTPTARQTSHHSRDRKRRLTGSAEQGRLQRTRSGEINRTSVHELPHRSVSMINPSSRTNAIPTGSGSSRETAIDITSSPPEAGPSGNARYNNHDVSGSGMFPTQVTAGSVGLGGSGPVRAGIDSPGVDVHAYRSRPIENPLPCLPRGERSSARYQPAEVFPQTSVHPWEAAASGSVPRPGRRHHSSSFQNTTLEHGSHHTRPRGVSEAILNSRRERERERYAPAVWQESGTDERTLRAFLSGAPETQSLAEALRSPHEETDVDTTLPAWQPDAEVTNCPICGTAFGLWYRKHHCRKCGRVVCASCSPHRITIPRQYIVRPPWDSLASNSSPTPPRQVVDLTDDDPIPLAPTINPALGGGEEVRLCNPCVPDPNPNPLGYGVRSRGHRSTYSLPSNMGNIYTRDQADTANHQFRYEYSGEFLQEPRSTAQQNRRDQDSERVRHRRSHRDSQSSVSTPRQSAPAPRPPVSENDLCPICGRRFPDISSSQPLELREEHVRQCIENYGAPAPTAAQPTTSTTTTTRRGPAPPPPPPPPPPAARMLEFTATEKDCLGEDGGTAECTICMVDYEVGDVLVRLECLCKFHKHCILDWFDHKMECPVHKVN
ncbi:hypothetical protein N7478_008924 [Penicillium angulare]|uniref:uncharacterized protein n=1 Tax=Penicillium angulare TaxID=116970 RepID=UPI0025408D50|nr:uncharacterized protein N7478_008924 [Penicillium angulare]KAJ5273799.1 hypothetical protein N7478_008924 [Penicillium angulare]